MAPVQDGQSSFLHIERISQYVPLSPASLDVPLPSVCAETFSPLLLTYYAPVRGVVLAYQDVKLSASPPRTAHKKTQTAENDDADEDESRGHVLLRQIDEYSSPYVWATASLLVWRPEQGARLSATVTHQAATHITLSHLNTFAISVLAEHLPTGWEWIGSETGKKKRAWDGAIADEGGCWVDENGKDVLAGRSMEVGVREWDFRGKGKGVLRVQGTLLSKEEESRRAEKRKGKGKRSAGEAMQID